MDISEIKKISSSFQKKAKGILEKTSIIKILEESGLRVNLVGSLKMGLLMNHRDIDIHIYSKNITVESSFKVIAKIASIDNMVEAICINGLNTEEHCMEWHLKYIDTDHETWQIDIIHIEEGSRYDGYFEKMANRICEIITLEQREIILKLKYLSSVNNIDVHGVEIYEAVIDNGITDLDELKKWIKKHRTQSPYFWMPL